MRKLLNQFHAPRPIPLLFSVVGIGLMLTLAIWQVQRLNWKETLIERIAHANAQAPLASIPTPEHIKEHEFYLVEVTGHYPLAQPFHIAARYHNHELGYHIFTPFELTDGTLILLNRGWVPAKEKNTFTDGHDISGMQTIRAQIRTGNDRNQFTPPNQPADNIWYGRDIAEMAAHSGLPFYEAASFDLVSDERSVEKLPIPASGTIALRNDHLSYAITWFAIAFSMLVITLLYHRKKPDER